jgi:hypothetical protein
MSTEHFNEMLVPTTLLDFIGLTVIANVEESLEET